MLRYIGGNIKNSITSSYFFLGVFVLTGMFFCSGGRGILCVQIQEKPLIIQEIFRYSLRQYERNILEYSAAAMFKFGMEEFMYLVMPLAGIGYLIRFSDEQKGGYNRLIMSRIGKQKYFAGALISSALLSIITVFISGIVIVGVLYSALPSGSGIEGVPGLKDCLRQLGFACVLAILGNWIGFLVAVVTESHFLSIVTPVLFFEIWTEICMGARGRSFITDLNLKRLFDPLHTYVPMPLYFAFVIIGLGITGGGFYMIAIKKMERGR